MSIQSQINRLNSAKSSIKSEIEKLGITIPEGTTLDGYTNYIAQYAIDFNNRLQALEEKAEEAIYFESTPNRSGNSVEERLTYLETLEDKKMYFK